MRVVRYGADGIVHLSNPAATTRVKSVCCECKAVYAEAEWPWNGREEDITHGLCLSCYEAGGVDVDEAEEAMEVVLWDE